MPLCVCVCVCVCVYVCVCVCKLVRASQQHVDIFRFVVLLSHTNVYKETCAVLPASRCTPQDMFNLVG